MVGVQTPLSGPHGDQPHQAPAQEPAGQHQGQEHVCERPERAHHRQSAGPPPGRGNHAGESLMFQDSHIGVVSSENNV